jgi:hypothetical protein
MAPFTTITGIAAPLLRDDINTDEITPIQIARSLEPAMPRSCSRPRAGGPTAARTPISCSTGRNSAGPPSW